MAGAFGGNLPLWVLHGVALCLLPRSTVQSQAYTYQEENCTLCPDLQSTFTSTVQALYNLTCTDEQATLRAEIVCRQGFRQTVDSFTARCTCNSTSCDWELEGTCNIEIGGVLIAAVAMICVLTIFFVFVCCLVHRKRCGRGFKRALYETSRDGSIIDGHYEPEACVVSIGMRDVPPSPRIIPIEDLDELASVDSRVEGPEEPGETPSTRADVHHESVPGSNVNGVIPAGLQSGTSTERLLDEDTGPVDLSPGAVDSPIAGEVESEPVYAKIDRSKRARDPSRPRGRRAGIDDLLSRIDDEKPSDSASASAPASPVENVYAEVGAADDSAVPTPRKPGPKVATKPASRRTGQVRRYAPPSQLRSPAKDGLPTASVSPASTPSPESPPADGVDGLYAQINRHRESLKEHAATQGERESPGSADEGFVEQPITRV